MDNRASPLILNYYERTQINSSRKIIIARSKTALKIVSSDWLNWNISIAMHIHTSVETKVTLPLLETKHCTVKYALFSVCVIRIWPVFADDVSQHKYTYPVRWLTLKKILDIFYGNEQYCTNSTNRVEDGVHISIFFLNFCVWNDLTTASIFNEWTLMFLPFSADIASSSLFGNLNMELLNEVVWIHTLIWRAEKSLELWKHLILFIPHEQWNNKIQDML